MLKVRFTRIKNTVVMEVLEQSINDSKYLDYEYVASNGFELKRIDEPEINSNCIFLRGADESKDDFSCSYDFPSDDAAINFITKAEKAIKEFNKSYPEKETVNNDNYIVTTIAQ